MRLLLISLNFVLIEWSLGAPTSGCESGLEELKEIISTKAALKSSLVSALLEQVNGVDILSKDGDNLLLLAARNGVTDVVYELMKLTTTVTVSKDVIASASKLAKEAGFNDVVDILKNASVAEIDDNDKVGKDKEDTTALLGVDENEKDRYGNTAFHRAARGGDLDMVELMVTANWNVNRKGESGQTPLHLATMLGHTEVVERLLKVPGIEVSPRDKSGRTPLKYALSNGRAKIAELLLKMPGVDVNARDEDGWTHLSRAAYWGKTNIVELLLKIPGIEVNKRHSDGKTPLYVAAEAGRTDIVKLLLNIPGIEVNTHDKYGSTPLSWAAKYGRDDVVKLLKAAGASD